MFILYDIKLYFAIPNGMTIGDLNNIMNNQFKIFALKDNGNQERLATTQIVYDI